jgi:adenosylcobinamide kinase/adenosylcobinamide-phosphate guanylyltransferase
LAETKALSLSNDKKPYYIATYDNTYNDKEMSKRIQKHLQQRQNSFKTIEEIQNLEAVIKPNQTYLVDCISMWILNNIKKEEEALLLQLEKLSKIESNIVFVLNDVNSGIIPFDKESRKFVDLTGILGQKLASFCDEVYEVKLGLSLKLK